MKKRFLPVLLTSLFALLPLSCCGKVSPPTIQEPLVSDEPVIIESPPKIVEEEPILSEPPVMEEPIIENPPVLDEPEIDEEPMNEEPTIKEEPTKEEPPIADEKPIETQTYIRSICEGLNIRSGPSTAHTVFGQMEKDTLLPCYGQEGSWYKTCYKGKTAYVSANSTYTQTLTLLKSNERTERVIEAAYSCLGTKYVYGATRLHDGKGHFLKGFTASEFDCSSLVQYAFYEGAGVLLDVTTRTQFLQGQKVEKENLSRGDCIYFTNSSRVNKTGIERIGHVAIYLGDGYVLHTASDFCKIEKMSLARWNYTIEARRFI